MKKTESLVAMNKIYALFISCALSLGVSAQNSIEITPPYNPDSNVDGNLGITDLMQLLAGFGTPFEPDAILVDGQLELGALLETLILTIQSLQEDVAELEAQIVPGLADYVSVNMELDLVQISGANLAVNNGMGNSAWNNGLGNLWLGYNEDIDGAPLARTGSHNLIIGNSNAYTNSGNLIVGAGNEVHSYQGVAAGTNNTLEGVRSMVFGGNNNLVSGEMNIALGGVQNHAHGTNSVVVGGQLNETDEYHSVAVGGYDNLVDGPLAVSIGGHSNHATGGRTSIFGGAHNVTHIDASSDGGSVFGGRNNTVVDGSVLGGRYNTSRGEDNVIVGGYGNQLLTGIDVETGSGLYNRQSVMIGGFSNVLDADLPDFRVLIGELDGVHIGTMDAGNGITP